MLANSILSVNEKFVVFCHMLFGALLSIVLGTSEAFKPHTMSDIAVAVFYVLFVVLSYLHVAWSCVALDEDETDLGLLLRLTGVIFPLGVLAALIDGTPASETMSIGEVIKSFQSDICLVALIIISHLTYLVAQGVENRSRGAKR